MVLERLKYAWDGITYIESNTGDCDGIKTTYANGDIEEVVITDMNVSYKNRSIICYVQEYFTSASGKQNRTAIPSGKYTNGMFIADDTTFIHKDTLEKYNTKPIIKSWVNRDTGVIVTEEPSTLLDSFGILLWDLVTTDVPNIITQYTFFRSTIGVPISLYQLSEVDRRFNL